MKERDGTVHTAGSADFTSASAKSVKSGMTMNEITTARPAEWRPNRALSQSTAGARRQRARPMHADAAKRRSSIKADCGREMAPCPEWMPPQLATLVDEVPEREDWLYELKYDGYRMLCRIDQGAARLYSRNGKERTAKLTVQADAAAKLDVINAWLDGEIVALAADGTMSFQSLQNAFGRAWDGRLVYFVFDLLFLYGIDLRRMPLQERKRRLAALLAGQLHDGPLRYSDHIRGNGRTVFETACRRGLEGLIAKRADGQYVQGRNRNWLKLKCHCRQEFVIGGFTDPSGSRRGFGALLLGVYEKEQGHRFMYVGRVGTGFSGTRLSQLHGTLREIERPRPSFTNPPTGWDAKGVHWVEPKLVAEVRFAEWTQEGQLRQAAFLGLRNDKSPRAIVREAPRSFK